MRVMLLLKVKAQLLYMTDPKTCKTEHPLEFEWQHKRITKCFAQHLTSLSGLDLLTLTLTIHPCEKFQVGKLIF